MPTRHRGKIIGVLSLGLIVLGFILIKAPTPIISIAAEPIIDGGYEVTNTLISAWVIMVLMAAVVFWLYFTKLRDVEKAMVPSGFQNVIEALLDAFFDVVKLVAGEKNGRRFFPVISSIFLILLFANWFGLFPWNNSFGRTVDLRFEYVELLELDAEDVVAAPEASALTAASANAAFGTFYLDPIPFETAELDAADTRIGALLLEGALSESELAVRAVFAADPIGAGVEGRGPDRGDRGAGGAGAGRGGASEALLERYGATTLERAVEHGLVWNLPLRLGDVDEAELSGYVLNSGGGVNTVPIKAEDFEFDPFLEAMVVSADGDLQFARLFDSTAPEDEANLAPQSGESIAPVNMNTAHVGSS